MSEEHSPYCSKNVGPVSECHICSPRPSSIDVQEVEYRYNILKKWDRDRIVKFAKHLLGDICQKCDKP